MSENTSKTAKEEFKDKPDRKRAEQSDKADAVLNGKCVLFADDDKTSAHLMMHLLSEKGIRTEYATDGDTAMKMFADSPEGHYDAVILDVHMPVVNGHEAALAIRKMRHSDSVKIPIIAVTGFEGEEEKELSEYAGITVHLTKPVDPKKLYDTLRELLSE